MKSDTKTELKKGVAYKKKRVTMKLRHDFIQI